MSELKLRPPIATWTRFECAGIKTQASVGGRAREMVEVGCSGILQLLCCPREHGQSSKFSVAGDPPLDACASAPRPKAPDNLAPTCRSCGPLASPTCHPSSLSQPALRRQPSEVRAACSNPARADPCGGRQATGVPTATCPSSSPDTFPYVLSISRSAPEAPLYSPSPWYLRRQTNSSRPAKSVLFRPRSQKPRSQKTSTLSVP